MPSKLEPPPPGSWTTALFEVKPLVEQKKLDKGAFMVWWLMTWAGGMSNTDRFRFSEIRQAHPWLSVEGWDGHVMPDSQIADYLQELIRHGLIRQVDDDVYVLSPEYFRLPPRGWHRSRGDEDEL